MLNLRENFYSVEVDPSTVDTVVVSGGSKPDAVTDPKPDASPPTSAYYANLLKELRKAIESNNEKTIAEKETEIQTALETFTKTISTKQDEILAEEDKVGKVSDIIDNEREKELLAEGENVTAKTNPFKKI